MALLLDKPVQRMVGGRLRWTAHLVSDVSLEELHGFAAVMGYPTKAFHNKPKRPHYDILDLWIGHTLAAGAQPVSARTVAKALIQIYGR
jgi:Protein of unknown function (DUF4031)